MSEFYIECHGYHAFLFHKNGFVADNNGRFIVDDVTLCNNIISECEQTILKSIDIVRRYGEEDGDTEKEIAENIILSVFVEFVNEQKVRELTINCKNILQIQHDILVTSNDESERMKMALEESERMLKNLNNLVIKKYNHNEQEFK